MAGGGGGDEFEVGINLTALLDVLTNLLFFLMFGYAAQQFSMDVEGGIVLPETSSEIAPKKDVQVSISKGEVRVDNQVVATLKNGKIDATRDSRGNILPLFKRLTTVHDKRVSTAVADADILLILCDKDIPYGILRSVMMTSAEAGFHKFRVAALMH